MRRSAALWFGIAADVKCDLSVTLTHCQQCLPPLDASPAAGMCPTAWWEVPQTACVIISRACPIGCNQQATPPFYIRNQNTAIILLGASGCACTLPPPEWNNSFALPQLYAWNDVSQFKFPHGSTVNVWVKQVWQCRWQYSDFLNTFCEKKESICCTFFKCINYGHQLLYFKEKKVVSK